MARPRRAANGATAEHGRSSEQRVEGNVVAAPRLLFGTGFGFNSGNASFADWPICSCYESSGSVCHAFTICVASAVAS